MTFKGKYFDGKSSSGYRAEVTLEPFHIRIVYTDAIEQTKTVLWNTDLVHKNDFAEHDRVYLKYGNFPFEYIEVYDKEMEAALKTYYPNAVFHKSAYNKLFSTGVAGLVIMAAFTIGFIALCYFVLIPKAAETLAGKLPISYEKQLGEAVYNNMTQLEEKNDSCSVLLNRFFKQLNYKTDYPIEITVIKSDVVNAYALPGGRIVVYEGILQRMESQEELVALLSHEFSHVQFKHSTKNICRSLSSYLLISLLVGDAGGITAVVLQNADQLKQLGYSRSLEEEADREGMKLMKQNDIDLHGMRHLFETLKKQEGDAGVPEFLSTHPLTDARIKAVTKEINAGNSSARPHPELESLWQSIKETSEYE
ncbi:MAG TPA: M48 family metallopeptidase [Chitinophagales bacterium]|nr:M48 family metallopeptidase [Chitinophagales bacterium]